jgi:flagellin
MKEMTDAASSLGAVKSRIGLQQDFVKSLMDALDRGVGTLIDADMNEESTKLQALQVQQQLGVQALSIANSSTQSILKLFQ